MSNIIFILSRQKFRILFLAAQVFIVPGCSGTGDSPPATFPPGFLFGTATAGFQVEMGCPSLPIEECRDPNSDWYAYVTDGEIHEMSHTYLHGRDPAVTGPGHWELFESDYDLATQILKNNSFRLGLEWSRIFPRATDDCSTHADLLATADPEALATYHAMFDALAERQLTPMVTIHHYTMPSWIHDGASCTKDFDACSDRGWLEGERSGREIAKFAGFVAREFGEHVDLWTTQNEPFAVLMSGYLMPSDMRSNPPALKLDSQAALEVYRSMIEAHALMADAVRANDDVDADGDGNDSRIGIAYAMAPVFPKDPSSSYDLQAAEDVFYLWNLVFLDAIALGQFDEDLTGRQTFTPRLADRLDFIGLNYKGSIIVEGALTAVLPDLSPQTRFNPLTLDYGAIHPRGLFEMCQLLQQRYALPIYITENNGQQLWRGDEAAEEEFLVKNLQWVAHALERGIDIRGFYYWAFMDNYEWNHGMTIGLGMFAVDPDDPEKRRRARTMVPSYADIAEYNRVSPELQRQFPILRDSSPTGGIPEDL